MADAPSTFSTTVCARLKGLEIDHHPGADQPFTVVRFQGGPGHVSIHVSDKRAAQKIATAMMCVVRGYDSFEKGDADASDT